MFRVRTGKKFSPPVVMGSLSLHTLSAQALRSCGPTACAVSLQAWDLCVQMPLVRVIPLRPYAAVER